jgi:hypothetical protein
MFDHFSMFIAKHYIPLLVLVPVLSALLLSWLRRSIQLQRLKVFPLPHDFLLLIFLMTPITPFILGDLFAFPRLFDPFGLFSPSIKDGRALKVLLLIPVFMFGPAMVGAWVGVLLSGGVCLLFPKLMPGSNWSVGACLKFICVAIPVLTFPIIAMLGALSPT